MKSTIVRTHPETTSTDMIAIVCFERREKGKKSDRRRGVLSHADGGVALDRALGGEIGRQITAEAFRGERGSHRLFFTAGRIPARYILVIGVGPKEDLDLPRLRTAGGQLNKAAAEIHATSAALVLEPGIVHGHGAPARARAVVEGAVLGAYHFDMYKTDDEPKPRTLDKLTFLYNGKAEPVEDALKIGYIVANATNAARDLVNRPACDATPKLIAKQTRAMAAKRKLNCTILGLDAIKKQKMGGLLAVSRGSVEPPAFITLTYKPRKTAKKHLALVGKGVTFDSGGISIKPSRGMDQMKGDMAGAASVLMAMDAIGQLKPDCAVSAFIPLAENMPDAKATKPGDVIRMRSGINVEVLNTDAEGRLILADAIDYAIAKKPDAIIDLATLTGGAAYCTGEIITPILGTDQKLIDRLMKISQITGERMWQLPVVEEYKKGYTSSIADMNNTGKSKAQTILGGLFLHEFIGDIPWIHMDIAATSWSDEENAIHHKGGTGVMVRTLVELAMEYK